MTTKVDLTDFNLTPDDAVNALLWIIENQGPLGKKRKFSDLKIVEFEDGREATHFILRWSK